MCKIIPCHQSYITSSTSQTDDCMQSHVYTMAAYSYYRHGLVVKCVIIGTQCNHCLLLRFAEIKSVDKVLLSFLLGLITKQKGSEGPVKTTMQVKFHDQSSETVTCEQLAYNRTKSITRYPAIIPHKRKPDIHHHVSTVTVILRGAWGSIWDIRSHVRISSFYRVRT